MACIAVSNTFGQFQKNIGPANRYYHDLNVDGINDLLNDFAVAGNLFDANFTNQLMTLHRINQAGSVVWSNTYNSSASPTIRVLDIVNHVDEIYATGYIEINGPGTRSAFIVEINAVTGAVNNSFFYDFFTPPFNSLGFKIIYTDSDADGDGVQDPGLVIAGYYSSCTTTNPNCAQNTGFVLRTDLALIPIWNFDLENANISINFDYDFINGIIETPTGFFLTGSINGNIPGTTFEQQGVLAHKIDFLGTTVWDSSYLFGNFRDVSVDAFYDAASQQIYMLSNYSQTHYFGVTLLNDITGTINPSSWYVTDLVDLNRYGFKIMQSISNPNNLVVAGYDRDQNWTNASSNPVFGQSNIFLYEFDKTTGIQVGNTFQYLVPHTEHAPDEFNFWSGQQPLIYYPDMSLEYTLSDGSASHYYNVGYRTDTSGDTRLEFLSVNATLQNICVHINTTFTLNPLVFTPIFTTTRLIPFVFGPIPVIATPLSVLEDICNDTILAIIDQDSGSKIKLFPNPALEMVNIFGENLLAYNLFDTNGRLVLHGSLRNTNTVNLGNLKTGLYFIEVWDVDANKQTFKLIKK